MRPWHLCTSYDRILHVSVHLWMDAGCREQIDDIHALHHTNRLTSFSAPPPPIFFLFLLLLDLVLGTILMAYGSMPLPLFVAAPREEYTPEKLPPSCALLCHGPDRGRKDIHVNRVRMKQRRKGK